MMKKIISDIDGVVVNYADPAIEWANRYLGWERAIDHDRWYGFVDLFGKPREEVKKLVEMFATTDQFSRLPPYKDAVSVIRELHEKEGYVVDFITAASGDYVPAKLRDRNMRDLFGTAVNSIVYTTGGSKKKALEKYVGTGCLFVDDHPENCRDAISLGIRTVMMVNPSNEHEVIPGVYRAYDWKTIKEQFIYHNL